MKISELKIKSSGELHGLLRELRAKERDLNFKIAVKQAKNVRELRAIKKTIARIFTLMNMTEHKQANSTKK